MPALGTRFRLHANAGIEITPERRLKERAVLTATCRRVADVAEKWRASKDDRRLRYSVGLKNTPPSGGSVTLIECRRPFHRIGLESTPPRLPCPLPPSSLASVFKISRQRPCL